MRHPFSSEVAYSSTHFKSLIPVTSWIGANVPAHSDLSITLGVLNIIFMACDPTVINASSPANIPAVRKGNKDMGVWYAKELSHLSEK